ncbi:MAG: hypothetical protein FWD57_15885 [Polyangiaceae bacterium]|nr:hypothetical protein [Polyangiaceae bacterium]
MKNRQPDIEFGADELLWRRIEAKDLDCDGVVKANSLRLQVSVVRQKYGDIQNVPHLKWNGVAVIAAQTACNTETTGHVRVVCVDDPNTDEPGHALIAFVAGPGSAVSEAEVTKTRAALAELMRIAVPPQRVR